MRTFHGVRKFKNIVHNAEPGDLYEPLGFSFSIHLVVRRLERNHPTIVSRKVVEISQ